jgi:uncharacterized protein (TIGR01777 family)
MAERVFVKRSDFSHSAASVFAWHARPGALERLIPPWSRVRAVARDGGIEDGSRVELRMPVGPMSVRWLAEHRNYVEGQEFTDVQVDGPFSLWEHRHRVTPTSATSCTLEDTIRYKLPVGLLGDAFGASFVRSELERTFAYRHRVTRHDLDAHARCEPAPASVAVTGASGLVGSVLVPFLRCGGHRVIEIGRSYGTQSSDQLRWDPARGELDTTTLEGIDAVVHLAGDNIASGRWSEARKRSILDSRVGPTRLLAERLASMKRKPRVLVSASAIGFYGERGDNVVTEADAVGEGFLSDVCRQWEASVEPAVRAGIRVVVLRIGVVLSRRGGALARMLPPFLLGGGGVLGSGRQFMSWISLEDVVALLHHSVVDERLTGPVNAVAPQAVTNREFTRTLARVLRRPALVPVPAFALRAAVGEMADALLLASTRVASTKLADAGFVFLDADLEAALRWELGQLRGVQT